MLRKVCLVLGALAVAGLVSPAMAGDCPVCKKVADEGEGFCSDCGKGLAYGVKMASKTLYDALVGVNIKQDKMTCPGCQAAAKKNGWCDHCNVGLAGGKAYKAPVAYYLAKGKPTTAEKAAHCGDCKVAFAKNSFCTGCNAGYVAGRVFKDRPNYDTALNAHKTLRKAAETATKCEQCAVAMVTDGTCEHCNVSFKNGEPIKK